MKIQQNRSRRYEGDAVSLICDTGEVFCAARILDISETGALLHMGHNVDIGVQLALIPVGANQEDLPLEIACEVVRRAAPQAPPASVDALQDGSLGVRFLHGSHAQRWLLKGFLEDCAADGAAQPFVESRACACGAHARSTEHRKDERRGSTVAAYCRQADASLAV